MADKPTSADLMAAFERGKQSVTGGNVVSFPTPEPDPPRYATLIDALEGPFQGEEHWAALRTSAIAAIRTLRHENEVLREEDLTTECKALEKKNEALRRAQAEAFREINQLRLDVKAAKQATADETRERRSKALRIAQDRAEALEVQLAAWKAEPLVSRIWRAWRGV